MLAIFDLDGTLIDSKRDLVDSVNATLTRFDRAALADETVSSYVGNGAPMLLRRAFGESAGEDLLEEALRFFMEYYREHCLDHTQFYPGITEVLEAEHGYEMAVLTNKPVLISEHILERLGVTTKFRRVYGGNSFAEKKPDPVGIVTLMRELNVAAAETVMIGDSGVDVATAKNAGVRAVGVTWGLHPDTLGEADVLVHDADELRRWMIGG